MDQSGISQQTPGIKHQNCSANLDYTRYPESLQILIEFLRSSVLNTALTAQASVSIKSLTRAYTTSKYSSAKNVVEFELETGLRTAISKTSFTKLLNLSTDPHLIDPDSVSSPYMINTFNTMGHTLVLTRLSAFKKNKLPSLLSCLFTILFKWLAERKRALTPQVSSS